MLERSMMFIAPFAMGAGSTGLVMVFYMMARFSQYDDLVFQTLSLCGSGL